MTGFIPIYIRIMLTRILTGYTIEQMKWLKLAAQKDGTSVAYILRRLVENARNAKLPRKGNHER